MNSCKMLRDKKTNMYIFLHGDRYVYRVYNIKHYVDVSTHKADKLYPNIYEIFPCDFSDMFSIGNHIPIKGSIKGSDIKYSQRYIDMSDRLSYILNNS